SFTAGVSGSAATQVAAVFDEVTAGAIAISITNADGTTDTFESEALAALTGDLPVDDDDVDTSTDALKLQRLEDVAAEISRMTNGRVTAAVNDDKTGIELFSSENFEVTAADEATTGLDAATADTQVGFRDLD